MLLNVAEYFIMCIVHASRTILKNPMGIFEPCILASLFTQNTDNFAFVNMQATSVNKLWAIELSKIFFSYEFL